MKRRRLARNMIRKISRLLHCLGSDSDPWGREGELNVGGIIKMRNFLLRHRAEENKDVEAVAEGC